MSFTQTYSQTILDYAFPLSGATDHIAYSTNGTSEFAGLTRTPVGATGWAAATAAQPSVKSNDEILLSAAATSGGTVSHFAVFSQLTGGVQKTEWRPLAVARTIVTGDKLEWAVGDLDITLD